MGRAENDNNTNLHSSNSSSRGNWRWVVLVSVFLNLMVNASVNYHMGVLNVAVLDTFQSDPLDTSWLLSFYSSLFALAAPVASVVINMTSCRTCVFLSGIISLVALTLSSVVNRMEWLFATLTLAGIGQAMSQNGGTVILLYYFPDKLPLINGICLAGAGLGSFLHPMLLQILIDVYALPGAFLLIGAISFHSSACGLLFRPVLEQPKVSPMLFSSTDSAFQLGKNKNQDTETVFKKIVDVLRIPSFTLFILSNFFFALAFSALMVILPDFAIRFAGMSHQEASLAAALCGIGSVVSRLLIGGVASHGKIGEMSIFSFLSAIVSGLSFAGLALMRLKIGVFAMSFLFGLCTGGLYVLINPIIRSLIGLEKAATGTGYIMLAFGLGSIAGPPMATVLMAQYGYLVLCIFVGLMECVSCMLAVLSAVFQFPRKKRKIPDPHDQVLIIQENSSNGHIKPKHEPDLEDGDCFKKMVFRERE